MRGGRLAQEVRLLGTLLRELVISPHATGMFACMCRCFMMHLELASGGPVMRTKTCENFQPLIAAVVAAHRRELAGKVS
jgi:hypothetical protein